MIRSQIDSVDMRCAMTNTVVCGDQVGEGLADEHVRPHVERAGRLVEDHDVGIVDERAGDAQPLPLPAGELVAPLTHVRVVAERPRGDLVVEVRALRRAFDRGDVDVVTEEADVVGDRAGEQRAVPAGRR